MISLDTNVLIRILIDDPESAKQNQIARTLAKKHKRFFISQIVQVETAWVMEKAYKLTKPALLKVLDELEKNNCFTLQREDNFGAAKDLYSQSNTNFGDCLIYTESMNHEVSAILTFDKRFSKIPKVRLLT